LLIPNLQQKKTHKFIAGGCLGILRSIQTCGSALGLTFFPQRTFFPDDVDGLTSMYFLLSTALHWFSGRW